MHNRLNRDRHGGAWCPRRAVSEGVREWMQVDLGSDHTVTAVVTQVRRLRFFLYIST